MRWLNSLKLATGGVQKLNPDDADEQLDRYLAKVRSYPADIVEHTLATWDDQPPPLGEYFPRTAQLRKALDDAFAWRRELLRKLQGAIVESEVEVKDPPTEEEIEQVEAIRRRVLHSFKTTPTLAEIEVERNPQTRSFFQERLDRAKERDDAEIERMLHPEAFNATDI